MDIISLENAARLLASATGIAFEAEELDQTMAAGIERDRELNDRFGLERSADTLPRRFLEEPLESGPSKGQVVDIEKMVDEYHALHPRK